MQVNIALRCYSLQVGNKKVIMRFNWFSLQTFVVLSMALAIASCAAVDNSSKQDKRGLFDETSGEYDSSDFSDELEEEEDDEPHGPTFTKNVPVPYPVEVEKKVPVYIEKKVPVYIKKKVRVNVDRPVPYPVEVKVPVIQKEYIEVPRPYAVEKKVPVYVKRPVYIDRPVPVTVFIRNTIRSGWWEDPF